MEYIIIEKQKIINRLLPFFLLHMNELRTNNKKKLMFLHRALIKMQIFIILTFTFKKKFLFAQ